MKLFLFAAFAAAIALVCFDGILPSAVTVRQDGKPVSAKVKIEVTFKRR